MSFLHPGLLALAGLAAVPVVLHLLLRPKPKKFLFPALRLIRDRKKQNSRRLKLRHLWLLLLRMAALALLAAAVARPSLPAANYAFTATEWLALAAVVVGVLVVYQVVLGRWRARQRALELPRHELLYRRSLLRAGSTVAAFLLAGLLVLWPYGRRVAAEVRAPVAPVAEDQPVAAALLFDTSLSTSLVQSGESRLAVAVRLAADHADTFPPGSKLAVLTTAPGDPARFGTDTFGAKNRLKALEPRPATLPLDGRIAAAVRLHADDRERTLEELGLDPDDPINADADGYVRAVYVFTDLAKSAWGPGGRGELAETLAARENVQVLIVDTGAPGAENVALGVPRPSRQSVPAGGLATVRVPVSRAAAGGDAEDSRLAPLPVEVELRAGAVGETMRPRGRRTVSLAPGGAAEVTFALTADAGNDAGAIEAEVALTRTDPLAFDDSRAFTVRVEPPLRVVVAADSPGDAAFFAEALAPSVLPENKRPAVVDVTGPAALARRDLAGTDVVFLLNVREPSADLWAALNRFTAAGGGVGVVLGSAVEPFAYATDAAKGVLPAELETTLAFEPPERLRVTDPRHPVFRPFAAVGSGTDELTSRDVRRHWRLAADPEARVPAVFTDPFGTPPAVVTGTAGAGRAAVVATGLDVGEDAWSDLPLARWSFVAFAGSLTRFLSGRGDERYNFPSADTLVVPLDGAGSRNGTAGVPSAAVLRRPDLSQTRLDLPAAAGSVPLTDVSEPGHYTLVRPAAEDEPEAELLSAFAVTLPEAESDLAPITPEELDERLGENRYTLSRTAEELELTSVRGRLGEEGFPYLLAVLGAVFVGELLVGNRFYEEG